MESYDFSSETDLSSFCQLRLRNFSIRTLDKMVLELRKLDRDREKIIHPATVENLVHKYSVPITPCIDNLLEKFEDDRYGGLVNYENLMQYLHEKKQQGEKKSQWPQLQDDSDNQHSNARDQTVTIRKGRNNIRRSSSSDDSGPSGKKLQRSRSWTDERENDLLQELRRSIGNQSLQVKAFFQYFGFKHKSIMITYVIICFIG